ncbi:TraB/GumN family protein [Polaribacter pectinis]|uniref:TraB/GumN family protein n=1 Tax=Polaribacter pectinis TaxID=2738844 RepID=A0A7G9LEB5_9FLAO|nr:TraB/GumN family protein [Polaribacter pectinis]QNM86964.1 TraB/GumN family protein [Polaribacter pectinis]
MKKRLVFVLSLLLSFVINSQENNSLLWKISGNGLEKDSYLYGTMHVSQKIAFHLDDVFYESLLKSDFVALESDPSFWLDNMFESNTLARTFGGLNSYGRNFYTNSFKLDSPKLEQLMFFISREDMLMNGILYRTNNYSQNFQEDTYLDMFIYQTGKKYGKKIFSLEDLERSRILVQRAQVDAMKTKPDVWLQKKMKKENYFSLLSNSYRDRNIQFIDSLNKGMYKENYLKNMLYIRNEEMANNIDSIARKGSLFSGIGAAHLAGEKGVISMLRKKGYTVTPYTSKESKVAKDSKSKIENKFLKIDYKQDFSSDKFFSAKLPNKLYELNMLNNTIYLSPDLANGSYVVITRINTFSYLKKDENFENKFNKLLYESIPGKIISKKEIERQGFKGLDIINKTKSGDYQRYHLFFTPLEILIFKMTGKKEFVNDFGNEFFNSIQLKEKEIKLEIVSPKVGGFSVEVPNNFTFTNTENIGNRLLQAYDERNNYYFVKEVVLNDVNYLEEDAFELERIHNRFYKELDSEQEKGSFVKGSKQQSYESFGKLTKENTYLHLKTITKGGHYFLLGFVSANKDKPTAFFKSFKVNDFKYKEEDFTIKKDTSLYFSVKTNVKPEYVNNFNRAKKDDKDYQGFFRSKTYKSKTNEEIYVQLKKEHDLVSYANLDSLSSTLIKREKRNFVTPYFTNSNFEKLNNLTEKSRTYIANSSYGKDQNNFNFIKYDIKDSLSSKVVKVKNIISNGAIYELKTLVDTTYATSKFIEEFYRTFVPKDTIIGKPLFVSKTATFFKLLKEKDSIALDGYSSVNFNKSDTDKLIDVINNSDFDDDQLNIKRYLIRELANNKSDKIDAYLKELYINSYDNPQYQIIVFNYFAKQKTKKSIETLLELLEVDIPLSNNNFDITNMFFSLENSLSESKKLYPDFLNYATITEYKKPIYSLLAKLVEKKMIKPKVYKSYRKQILNEAKIELKRQLGKKEQEESGISYNRYNNKSSEDDLLNSFVKILYPFRKDKGTNEFLSKIKRTNNIYANTNYLMLQIKNNENFDRELFSSTEKSLNSSGLLYKKLEKINKQNLFSKEFKTKDNIYKSLLFGYNNSQKIKDSIVFVEVRKFEFLSKKYEAYFFKSKPEKNDNSYRAEEWKLNVIVFKDINNLISTKPVYIQKNENIDETKPIKEVIDQNLEKILLNNRKRVDVSEANFRGGIF